ncbi:putative histidine kinase hhk3p [Rosellinia necatrix]|uniref:histidine kinase n=1 Tax=Rosellinia necatrix TaxID=77044 RepID=A0A1W2THG2_ROSNE|nr:putative histidine kinase hhk3p [Rosellinia necatrix]
MRVPQAHEHDVVTPYFPRSGSKHTSKLLLRPLPPPPKTVGPILDEANAKEPLPPFELKAHGQYYAEPSESGEALPPPLPASFTDRYLIPTLTRNERLRLTLLWYHTMNIEQNDSLLAEVDALVRRAHSAIGWEYTIAGILNESTYRRLAAVNLPLAILPRRESTCSHTINQGLDGVFMVLDMSQDWRFRYSPHSEIGGLRSYAGAPLRLTTDNGIEIPLGTLCVASDTPQKPLGKAQCETLISFSELISTAIASHTRQRRLGKRQEMTDLLSTLSSNGDAQDYEESAAGIIQQAYPGAHVALQLALEGRVPVKGRPAIRLSDIEEGFWEDTALIEHTIVTSNFDELRPAQTVRAIIARCGSSDKYVVVSGLDIHHVFDDFDSWFLFKAAAIIADTLQGRLLRQALAAREIFLRGITHQLRTPIHGVLGSTELLAEELAVRGLLLHNDVNTVSVSPATCINTLRNSAQELMRTVNSILKYNTWADSNRRKCHSPYDLGRLEGDILPKTLSHILQDHLHSTSVEFRNELNHSRSLVTDPDLLKDCLQEVLLNAIQSVVRRPSGTVIFIMRDSEDESKLIFDVVDNGVGIGIQDHSSIFQPFYKVDSFKLGAGLGLTLAEQIATSLQGDVRLISSSLDLGSHFRVEFNNPIFAPPHQSQAKLEIGLQHLPKTFLWKLSGTDHAHFADHIARHLAQSKFHMHTNSDVGLIFADSDIERLRDAYPSAVIIVFRKAETTPQNSLGPGISLVSGPLHTETLNQMLLQADTMYKELADQIDRRDSRKEVSPVDGAIVGTTPTAEIANLNISDGLSVQYDCDSQPVRALLVDDNPINLRILKMFCSKRKIPFTTAEDGNIAIKQFIMGAEIKKPFTLVLMDLQMPNCDGIEATRAIRAYERDNALRRSSIFMVTGQDWGKDKIACQEAGTDVFLIKPASPKLLDMHIARFFKAYHPADLTSFS